MPTEDEGKIAQKIPAQAHAEAVSAHVLRALGRPPDLVAVRARHLWGHHYRVNVFVGDAAAAKISHSFFVSCNDDGHFVSAQPVISREFPPGLSGTPTPSEASMPAAGT